MPLVTFYFQLHQPFRLHPDTEKFLWEENNRDVFLKVAEKCYLPATRMFTDLIRRYPRFKITFSMSGTFLEQAELYCPEVIKVLHDLYDAGKERRQVEYLQETYYHSLSALFEDPEKREFKDQVSLHRQKMRELFGVKPTAFRNTELMYNNDIANAVADMGFEAILCEQRDDMFTPQDGRSISPNAVFRSQGRRGRARDLIVLPRNRNLSDDVAFRFRERRLSPQQYADFLAKIDGEAVLLGYDYEHIGEHIWADTGIFDFWRNLPEALARHESIVLSNPSEVAKRFRQSDCPVVDIHPLSTSSWADMEKNTFGWLGSRTQYTLFREIEAVEADARNALANLLTKWRILTTSDNLYYLHEGRGADHSVHEYFSPYGSITMATYVVTRNLDNLRLAVKTFNLRKEKQVTPVIIIAPETGRLPSGMGELARLVSGKSGGLGEVISALCKGLLERRIPAHMITLNLKRRFREESHLSDEEWIQNRHKLSPANVHLVSSSLFEDLRSAYAGDPRVTAAEFQRQMVNTYIKEIRSHYEGRAILHTHDWMAGGVVSAYARLRQIPILHTVHNTHTAHIPLDAFAGVNLQRLHDYLYYSIDGGKHCLDSHATAIKNANKMSSVGRTFLKEIVENHFLDRPIIPASVRQEIQAKFLLDAALVIPNGISPDIYPENHQEENPDPDKPGLACRYGPDTEDLVAVKKANLLKFQAQMGLAIDSEAILLYWPSRLDASQKGVELLEDIALRFVIENGDVQIAVVGDPVGNDTHHAEVLGRIACASQGKVAYRPFDDDLCVLGYAAASDVFGASVYEPFGQIDVMANLYGATATNRDTGGYRDKIVPLSLKVWGAPQDRGNGVLFKNYDSGGLWWGLSQSVMNHRFFRKHPREWERQMRRIMQDARRDWSLENMVAGYVTAYESLHGGKPLS